MTKEMLIRYWTEYGLVNDKRLIAAFRAVPREEFVLEEYRHLAYADYALPLISGQTISQPTTVMIMTRALALKPGEKVLEVGAGSGYQAAIIAKMVEPGGMVITTEVLPELVELASKNLRRAGIRNVRVVHTDGSQGYEKEAPFDKIIVTAASPSTPLPLIDQLRLGGIVVIPVGSTFTQELLKVTKLKSGKVKTESLGPFAFVPLTGKYGHK